MFVLGGGPDTQWGSCILTFPFTHPLIRQVFLVGKYTKTRAFGVRTFIGLTLHETNLFAPENGWLELLVLGSVTYSQEVKEH